MISYICIFRNSGVRLSASTDYPFFSKDQALRYCWLEIFIENYFIMPHIVRYLIFDLSMLVKSPFISPDIAKNISI